MKEEKHSEPIRFFLCGDIGCSGTGSKAVYEEFRRLLSRRPASSVPMQVHLTGCKGLCTAGPVLEVSPEGTHYFRVTPEDAAPIIEAAERGERYEKRLYRDPESKERLPLPDSIPFYAGQKKIALAANGRVRPESLEDYLELGGFTALRKALEMQPEEIVAEVEAAGLRGRGGGGFPAGRKWRSVFEEEEPVRYLICNGDEGDPGAFMDRSLMQGAPFQILEGMIIGALAVGARQGYIYVRDEYPLAIKNLEAAISSAEEAGYLGRGILDSDAEFTVTIKRGAGAFVCGESSALMRSIEGKLGEPNEKYIHASERGLGDKPTVLNNVETFANVPYIINRGAGAFRSMGTEGSPGTKVFCLVGKVKNAGLVEVELGTSLRNVVEEIGGGITAGRPFKAVQTGGPSGGCIPASLADTPIDFDSLDELGSMMGSGGLIVMDVHDCMVEVARYFTNFLVEESCGTCTPCREGLIQILGILERITKGEGRREDIELLEELGEYVNDSSLCGLGKSAATPLLSTIRYFRDEYRDHIENGHCTAGVCKALTTFTIDTGACTKCNLCIKVCPTEAIRTDERENLYIDQELCIRCGECREVCRFGAVTW
jgi:NADH-quinone oxidoreductase subunit F